MKKLLIVFLFFSFGVFAQEQETYLKTIPTTIEEYKFLTAGLRDHLEKGTDMKQGYELRNSETTTSSDNNFKVYTSYFYKKEDNSFRAVSVIVKWGLTSYYFCIPLNNAELMKSFQSSLSEQLGENGTTYFSFALAKQLPILIDMLSKYKNELSKNEKK